MNKFYIVILLFLSSCTSSIQKEYLYENYKLTSNAFCERVDENNKYYSILDKNKHNRSFIYDYFLVIEEMKMKTSVIYQKINELQLNIASKDTVLHDDFLNLLKKSNAINIDDIQFLKDNFNVLEEYADSISESYNLSINTDFLFTFNWQNISSLNGKKTNSAELYTVLSSLEYRISIVEFEFFISFLSRFSIEDFHYNTIEAKVVLDKYEYKIGDTLIANICLSRSDSTKNYFVLIDGTQIEYSNGVGYYSDKITSQNIGLHTKQGVWKELNVFSGDTITHQFSFEYIVIQ